MILREESERNRPTHGMSDDVKLVLFRFCEYSVNDRWKVSVCHLLPSGMVRILDWKIHHGGRKEDKLLSSRSRYIRDFVVVFEQRFQFLSVDEFLVAELISAVVDTPNVESVVCEYESQALVPQVRHEVERRCTEAMGEQNGSRQFAIEDLCTLNPEHREHPFVRCYNIVSRRVHAMKRTVLLLEVYKTGFGSFGAFQKFKLHL